MPKYDDIVNHSRPESRRPKMSMHDRAAQFSPFAALTGHDDAIRETARRVDRKIELSASHVIRWLSIFPGSSIFNKALAPLNDGASAALPRMKFKTCGGNAKYFPLWDLSAQPPLNREKMHNHEILLS